jgi:hypothetical protein
LGTIMGTLHDNQLAFLSTESTWWGFPEPPWLPWYHWNYGYFGHHGYPWNPQPLVQPHEGMSLITSSPSQIDAWHPAHKGHWLQILCHSKTVFHVESCSKLRLVVLFSFWQLNVTYQHIMTVSQKQKT